MQEFESDSEHANENAQKRRDTAKYRVYRRLRTPPDWFDSDTNWGFHDVRVMNSLCIEGISRLLFFFRAVFCASQNSYSYICIFRIECAYICKRSPEPEMRQDLEVRRGGADLGPGGAWALDSGPVGAPAFAGPRTWRRPRPRRGPRLDASPGRQAPSKPGARDPRSAPT